MDKVIFRTFPDGEVIALFPQIAAGYGAHVCQSYMHIGQHGAASVELVYDTRLSRPEEYADLLAELEQIGYSPKPAKRFTSADRRIREEQVSKWLQIA